MYYWKMTAYPETQCEYSTATEIKTKDWQQEIVYKLWSTSIPIDIYIKIPLHMQYDIEWTRFYIENELNKYPFVDVKKAMQEFCKLYTKTYINHFDKVEEIEYKHHKEQQKPFKIIYRTGKIGGNGYFKDCELILYDLNEDYF